MSDKPDKGSVWVVTIIAVDTSVYLRNKNR